MAVQEWFDSHEDLSLISWPARSPDLNPIENVWGSMAMSWKLSNEVSQANLIEHCQRTWEEMRARPNFCRNLIESMPKRCLAVMEAEGGQISY